MFCTNCGKNIDDDAIYCNYCGGKVEKIEESKVEKIEEPKVEKIEEPKVEKIEEPKVEKIEEPKVEKIEEPKVEKIEEPKVEKIEDPKHDPVKGLSRSTTLCIFMAIIGFSASTINIIKFYLLSKDITYILGQAVFVPVFIISAVLLSKSKKTGGVILLLFSLFKMASSAYYYTKIPDAYFMPNLVIDEIFYLATMILVIIGWKNFK